MLRGKGSEGLLLIIFVLFSINSTNHITQLSEKEAIYSTKYPKFLLKVNHPITLHGSLSNILLVYLPRETIVSLNLTSKSILWTIYLQDYELLTRSNNISDNSITERTSVLSNLDNCGFAVSIIVDPLSGTVYAYCKLYKCRSLTSLNDVPQLISLKIGGSNLRQECFNFDHSFIPGWKEFRHYSQTDDIDVTNYYNIKYFYDSIFSQIELFGCLEYLNTSCCFNFIWDGDGISDYVSEIHIVTVNGDDYNKPDVSSDSLYTVSFVANDSNELCFFHVYNNGIKVLNKCSLSSIMYFLKNGLLDSYLDSNNLNYKTCSKFVKLDGSMLSLRFIDKFHSKSIKATRSILDASGGSTLLSHYKIMQGRFNRISYQYQNPILKFSWNIKPTLFNIKSQSNISKQIFNEETFVMVSYESFWKEILIAALVITGVVNLILYGIRHYIKRKIKVDLNSPIHQGTTKHRPSSSEESGYADIHDSSINKSSTIVSRYKNDFDHICCIGRGGFGVVFKSRNVLDDCLYAVKRIELPDCVDAREKVMREVKALAKLNHHGIIRFYNAWFEDAPEVDEFGVFTKQMSKSVSPDVSISPRNTYCSVSSVFSDTSEDSTLADVFGKCQSQDNDDIIIDFFPNGSDRGAKLWDTSHCTETDCTSSYASAKFQDDGYSLESEYSQDSDCVITSCRGDQRCVHSRKVHLYIQMQLCKNKTLRCWLKKTKSGRCHVKSLDIFRQILAGIEFIHFQCLTHRDLKPSNIFFAFDGSVKIGDFGLVTRLSSRLTGSYHKLTSSHTSYEDDGKNLGGSVSSNCSRTNFAGTSLYMSPEQIQGLPYDSKVDIYSLGLIFFELLIPFKTEMERYKMLTQARSLEFPQVLLLEYPLELNLLKWILDPDSSKRPTATQVRTSYAFQELMVLSNAAPLQLASGCRLA